MTRKYTREDLEQRIRILEAELKNAKRTVEALRESEAKYKKLSDKSLGVVYQFMMAPDGTYSFPYINESLRAVTGISPDEAMRDASVLIGKIHPEDIGRLHKGVLESANSLTPYHAVCGFFIDERQIWIEARSTPERMPDGSILWSGFFIDITERKLERDSLKRTQFAMDKAPDSILWVDDGGGIIYANEAACSSTGYTRDALQTMKVFDIDPDVLPDQFDRHKEDLRRQGTMTFESRHITKDGGIFPVEVSTRYFEYDDRWLACAFDRNIADRKQAEAARQTNENNLRSLFNAITETAFLMDRNAVILTGNDTFAWRLGKSMEECAGKSVYDLIPTHLVAGRKAIIEEVFRTGQPVQFEDEQEGRFLSHSLFPVMTAGGTVDRIAVFAMDVTERKQAEEALRESEILYQSIFENTGTTVLILEEDMTISFANAEFEKLTGYRRQEVVGVKKWTEFVEKSDLERMIHQHRLRRTADANLAKKSYEFRLVHRDGRLKDIYLIADMIPGTKQSVTSLVDITARKQTEAALQKLSRMQSVILNSSTVGIALVRNRVFEWVNPRMSELFGISAEQFKGASTRILFLNDELYERLGAENYPLLAQGKKAELETRMRKGDGSSFWCRLEGKALDASKPHDGSIWIWKDITDRKEAENALRESEQRFRSLAETTSDLVWEMNQDGFYTYISPKVKDLLGYTPDEVVGKSPFDFMPSETSQAVRSRFQELTKDRGPFSALENLNLHKDGRQIILETSGVPIFTQNGVFSGYRGIDRDITDRKLAEKALQESRRRLEDIVEFMPDAIMVIDRDGRLIAWNRAMETMSGVKKVDMLGKGDYEYALPFYGERRPVLIDFALHPNLETEKQYTALQRIGDTVFGEAYTPTLPSGNVHLSGTASVLRDSRGEIIGAIECLRDNTERRRLEERLKRSEKMEVLGALAGGVAHDLNNMLGMAVGYSELLAEKLPDTSPLKKYADNILQSSIRSAAIIQDLLTLTRRGVTVSEVADLNSLVMDCFRTPEFESLIFHHPQVNIRHELEAGLPRIKASPVHLSKTVINLVSNAAEAVSGLGEVTIRTESRHLDHSIPGYEHIKEGDYVVLTVADTGGGISPDDLERIFEPFYAKKVMGRSGTGLGLAVVWGTVKDHHGYIDVRSEEGKGSMFSLYFPATR